jgi:hypothetical protein
MSRQKCFPAVGNWLSDSLSHCLGGIVKRSLAMVPWLLKKAIAKAFGLDAATRNLKTCAWTT